MTPTDEIRARLDELGVEWETGEDSHGNEEIWWRSPVFDVWVCATLGEELGTVQLEHPMDITPEQAISATVEPNKTKEWRSVALGLFDSLEKADLEVAQRWLCENDLLGQEIAYGDAKAATVGRSCASCPEMGNPDSYISHLQSALKWHDEHVPRPTNPRNTCVVLKGQNPPEEVLFVHDEGGVTHYLPEEVGTCQNIAELNREGVSGYFFICSECGLAVHASFDIRKTNYPRIKPDGSTDLRVFNSNGKYEFERCPRCGRKVTK